MASTTTPQNAKLGVDVLCIIFDYCRSLGSIESSLNPLLLVCKDWSYAALQHHALWSKLEILVEHTPEFPMLRKRIKMLMKRSGTALLEIELTNLLDNWDTPYQGVGDCPLDGSEESELDEDNLWGASCRCVNAARKQIGVFLTLLAGPGGKNCKRWRALDLHPSFTFRDESAERHIFKVLNYPMPRLESLTLHNVFIPPKMSFLPSAPLLVKLVLDNCWIPPLTASANLRFVDISWALDEVRDYPPNVPNIRMATNLETLKLGLPAGFAISIPEALPNLQELQLTGEKFPPTIQTVHMESLTRLTIGVHCLSFLKQLTGCQNRHIWHVTDLTLWYFELQGSEPSDFKDLCSQLLKQCEGLQILKGDREMLGLVIKILWEQVPVDFNGDSGHVSSNLGFERIFGDRQIKLHRLFDEKPSQRLSPRDSRQNLASTAEALGAINPAKPWDEQFKLLGRYPYEML